MLKSKDPIVIVLASDQGYFEGLWVTLVSLFIYTNTRKHIKIYVFDGGIDDENKQKLILQLKKLNTNFSLEWLVPELNGFETFVPMGSSYMAYARILIPEMIFEEKVIWIDVDLLVLKDIELLWEQDIDGFAIAACLEAPETLFKDDLDNLDKFQIPINANYFNSGVLIMNIDELKQLNFTRLCFEFLEENNGQYKWHDQSAINVVCYNNIKVLERSFNQLNTIQHSAIDDLNLLRKGGYIYHFLQRPKPWQRYSSLLHSRLMYKIVDLSGFEFEKLKTGANRFEMFKWLYTPVYQQLNFIIGFFKKRPENEVESIGSYIKMITLYKKVLKPYQIEIETIFNKIEEKYHHKIKSNAH